MSLLLQTGQESSVFRKGDGPPDAYPPPPLGTWTSKDAKTFPINDYKMETTKTTPTLETFMTMFRAASPEQLAEILDLLPGVREALTPESRKPVRPEVALSPLSEDGGAPDASAYRIKPADIDHTTCMARRADEKRKDSRWSPAVYYEYQCGRPVEDGHDLCPKCRKLQEAYAESPKVGRWIGFITEEPMPWQHMLGTAWAEANLAAGKLKWKGGDE